VKTVAKMVGLLVASTVDEKAEKTVAKMAVRTVAPEEEF
jgi:hypothetical protein